MEKKLSQIRQSKSKLLNSFDNVLKSNKDESISFLRRISQLSLQDLIELYESWKPRSLFSSSDTRERLKRHVQRGHSIREIDAHMKTYFSAQIDYLGQQMAFQFAFNLFALMQESPNLLGFILLKRHEESNKIHKGAGFNSDTGLTAICMPQFASQTEFELIKLREMHTFEMSLLLQYARINVLASPVRRAYQTLLYTLNPLKSIQPKITHLLAEDSYWLSGKPRGNRKLIQETLRNFKNLNIEKDEKLMADPIKKRTQKAINMLLEPFLNSENKGDQKPIIQYAIGHGKMNKRILQTLGFASEAKNSLDYGEFYLLASFFSPDKKRIELKFIDQFSHFSRGKSQGFKEEKRSRDALRMYISSNATLPEIYIKMKILDSIRTVTPQLALAIVEIIYSYYFENNTGAQDECLALSKSR